MKTGINHAAQAVQDRIGEEMRAQLERLEKPPMRRIKIICKDGLVENLKVVDADSNESIDNVSRITVHPINAGDGLVRVDITYLLCELDIVAKETP